MRITAPLGAVPDLSIERRMKMRSTGSIHSKRMMSLGLSLAVMAATQEIASAFSLTYTDNAPSIASGKWSAVVDPVNPNAGLYVLNIGNSYQLYDASGYIITGFPHNNVAGVAWGVGHQYNAFVNPAVDGSITSVDFSITAKNGSYDGSAVAMLLMQNGKFYRTAFNVLSSTTSPVDTPFASAGLTPAAFGEFKTGAYDYATPANGSANFSSNPDFSSSGGTITFGYLSHFD